MVLGLAVGVPLGWGLFTFVYAQGASYLSTDPRACVNCHVMQPQYDSWQQSSHHTSAGCVDCHLPASGLEKWIAKGVNGWNHSKAFTTQAYPEPIAITPKNADILQANCLRCHGALVHDLVAAARTDAEAVRCVHCHFDVGHGPRARLGPPLRDHERAAER